MKNLIVMPTYNERGTIAGVHAALEHAVPDVDVVVVDDSSPDGTADLVRTDPRYGIAVFLLEREAKDGLGGAYRAGFGWGLEQAYEGVVQMDADLSHPPERVPALLDALREADVVVVPATSRAAVSPTGVCVVGCCLGPAPVRSTDPGSVHPRRHVRLQGVPRLGPSPYPRLGLVVERVLLPDRERLGG